MNKTDSNELSLPKWHWGAFFLTFIWGIFNNVWISLIGVIPVVGELFAFVLAVKGYKWAWKQNQWKDEIQFRRVQDSWSKWGAMAFIFVILPIKLFFYYMLLTILTLDLGQ